MDGALKKGVVLLVVLFLGFWLVQDPNGFAGSAKGAGSALWDLLVKNTCLVSYWLTSRPGIVGARNSELLRAATS